MPENPISHLQFAGQEIDRVFGDGYAAAHPDAVTAVMLTAATNFSALAISGALEHLRPRWPETELVKNRPGASYGRTSC